MSTQAQLNCYFESDFSTQEALILKIIKDNSKRGITPQEILQRVFWKGKAPAPGSISRACRNWEVKGIVYKIKETGKKTFYAYEPDEFQQKLNQVKVSRQKKIKAINKAANECLSFMTAEEEAIFQRIEDRIKMAQYVR